MCYTPADIEEEDDSIPFRNSPMYDLDLEIWNGDEILYSLMKKGFQLFRT